jgi:hypothetical protein
MNIRSVVAFVCMEVERALSTRYVRRRLDRRRSRGIWPRLPACRLLSLHCIIKNREANFETCVSICQYCVEIDSNTKQREVSNFGKFSLSSEPLPSPLLHRGSGYATLVEIMTSTIRTSNDGWIDQKRTSITILVLGDGECFSR